ncbi:helix-turn-helix domain-containing protein [Streptomyces sp. NPDC055663]
MPRWKALSDELDPQVREFAGQLRRLVDRRGLSIAAVADRTGYSRTSWERYLNGRLLAPKGAVVALAEATGTSQAHLTTMWELAERAWSRSEPRQDMTVPHVGSPGADGAGTPPRDPVTVRFNCGRGWPAAVGRRRPAVLLAGVAGALLVLAAVVLLLTGPGL